MFRERRPPLEPGGLFVVNGLTPETRRASAHPTMAVIPTKSGEPILGFRQVDRAEQRYVSRCAIREGEGCVRVGSVPFRYATPSELDLMASMAGLRLRRLTCGWKGEPFNSASEGHVSVHEASG